MQAYFTFAIFCKASAKVGSQQSTSLGTRATPLPHTPFDHHEQALRITCSPSESELKVIQSNVSVGFCCCAVSACCGSPPPKKKASRAQVHFEIKTQPKKTKNKNKLSPYIVYKAPSFGLVIRDHVHVHTHTHARTRRRTRT